MRRVRFIAMLLALILAFSSAIEVFADENDNQQQYVDNEAEDAGSIGEGYSEDQPGSYDQDNGYYDPMEQQAMLEQQFFDYWNNVGVNYDWSSYGYYDVNTELIDNNNAPVEKQEGSPNDQVIYEIVSPAYVTATPTPFVEETPEWHDPRGTINPVPDITPIPTDEPVYVPVPPQISYYVRPDDEPVPVAAVVEEPTKVVYDIDLEVGRYAFITPEKMIYSPTTSNKNIINKPERNDRWAHNTDAFYAQANNPGDATLTFTNTTNNHTEEWNVHVYCRPLDFEKTMYVVETPEKRDGYITLYLKYFEYAFEQYYGFEYSSSNTKVAYLAGGDRLSTYARFCIPKGASGSTVITVKDKYGNSKQAVILVQGPKGDGPAAGDNGKIDTKTDFSTLTAKQQKKAVKAVEVDLEIASNKTGKITLEWDTTANFDLDGYQVYVSGDKGKTFKKKKNIKKASTTKYKYTAGKDGKTYYFKVRGYKKVNGKTVYTEWSDVIKGKFSK